MSRSGRSSGRAADEFASHLVKDVPSANKGADGGRGARPVKGARIGRRGLAEAKGTLSDRHWAVLHSLSELHFMTARQVERLHYPPGLITPLSASRASRHDLAHLYALHFVDRLERRIGGVRAGSASFVYSLSPLGARLLSRPTRQRAREPSLLHLGHVLAVGELVVRLYEHQRDGELDVVEIETEPACWRPVPAAQGGTLTLKPDLRLTLGVGEDELHWFVEIDRGSEHRPVLVRKCMAYLAAYRSGREEHERGIFPRVLWVVPDTKRATALDQVTRSLPGAPEGMFKTATEDRAIAALLDPGDAR